MIIDGRNRTPFLNVQEDYVISKYFAERCGYQPSESYRKQSMDLYFQEMEEAGISKAVVLGRISTRAGWHINRTNDDVAKLVDKYPDKLIGVGSVDPTINRSEVIREITRGVRELGLKGMSIEPNWGAIRMYHNDRRLYAIYDKCQELDIALFTAMSAPQGPSLDYLRPTLVEAVAEDFPNLRIAIGHAGWPFVEEGIATAFKCPNVYLGPDVWIHYKMPGWEKWVEAANKFMQDQLYFGTAFPASGPLKENVEIARQLPFKNKEILEKYLYKNMVKLLKI